MGKDMKTDFLELKDSTKVLSGYDWLRIKFLNKVIIFLVPQNRENFSTAE